MRVQVRITDYVVQAFRFGRHRYCTPCLSQALGIAVEQIEQETRALEEEEFVWRSQGACTSCGTATLVTRRCISAYAA